MEDCFHLSGFEYCLYYDDLCENHPTCNGIEEEDKD